MKKFIIFLMGLLLISCSHNSDIQTLSEQEVKEMKYEQAFEQTFGTIDKNQTWGFSQTTRTVIKADMTNYPKTQPNPITDDERNYVTEWFQNNPGLSNEGIDFRNFFIQYVSGDVNNKKGIWHRYDQNRNPKNWDEEFTDNGGMDYLEVGDGITMEHVLDFNAKSGGPFGIIYMENSSALQFSYQSSWNNTKYRYFKMAEIDVPNVGKGWYVGLSLYGKKYDNGDKELGIQRLQYAEDWILKIVPATKEQGRIICEDLGNIGDFDFNDVVFDAYLFNDGTATISILAAGGTLDISVANVNIGEVFGKMTNTGLNDMRSPYIFTTEGTNYNSLIDIPIVVSQTDKAGNITKYILTAEMGKAPQKICVPMTFKWCKEYKSINDAYPKFKDWVQGDADTWCGEYNSELVMDLTNFNF